MSTVATNAGWRPDVVARSTRPDAGRGATAALAPAGGWELGSFRLQPCGTLLGPQGIVALTPKEEGVLRALVAADVLLGSLTRAVHTLRRRLGERPGRPVYIGTAYGRGYQLVVPVRRLD